MEINLERGDLLKLDAISNRGTLKLLPVGKKGKVSYSHSYIGAILYLYLHLQNCFLFFNFKAKIGGG